MSEARQRTRQVGVRLTPGEWERLNAEAKRRGVAAAEVLRTGWTATAGEVDTEACRRCGMRNRRWCAPSPLWNKVMRGNDINGDEEFGIVCIECFITLAELHGINPKRWKLSCDPMPDDLVYETPSGRVWDDRYWLWRDLSFSQSLADQGP